MVLEVVSSIARNLIPFGLVFALILFARLGIKSRSLSSLQAELSIFVIIWISAELPRSLLMLGMIETSPALQLLGLTIHTIAMIAFGSLIVYRFSRITRGKR